MKVRLLTIDSLNDGTTRRLVLAERSALRPGRSATRSSGPRYHGAVSCSNDIEIKLLPEAVQSVHCFLLSGESSCFKIVKMIMERNYAPVIVFSFSKKDCESYATQMSKLDFNTGCYYPSSSSSVSSSS